MLGFNQTGYFEDFPFCYKEETSNFTLIGFARLFLTKKKKAFNDSQSYKYNDYQIRKDNGRKKTNELKIFFIYFVLTLCDNTYD